MKLSTKKEILAFLKAHDDGSDATSRLIKKMEDECTHADTDAHSVSVDDLESLDDFHKNAIRMKLGKIKGDPWTLDDCEKIAESIDDVVSEEFTENLKNAIEYL